MLSSPFTKYAGLLFLIQVLLKYTSESASD